MNQLQADAWMALLTTAQLLPSALDEQLTADAGLINFEYGILGVLNIAPEQTMRMGELAAVLKSPAPRLSKAVNRLEARSLVERVACPGDGRAINVHLTREGRRTWLQVTPSHIAFARDTILGSLTPEELATLTRLLQPVIARLDPDACRGDDASEKSGP